VGVLYSIYTGKKLIESPLSHGSNVPCRFQNALNGEEIHNEHEMNIVKLPETVKLIFRHGLTRIKNSQDPLTLGWSPSIVARKNAGFSFTNASTS
jgi:hypothetical protein